MGHEKVHNGLITELGILLCKYKKESLMDHCRTYYQRMQTVKLIRACER